LTVGRFLVQHLQEEEEEEEEYCRPDRDGRSRRGGDEETDADDQQLLLCKTGIVITGLTTISIANPADQQLSVSHFQVASIVFLSTRACLYAIA
jgi:hypothetical protein